MTNQRVIGVDLGGTKILAGLIEDGRVLQTVARATPTTSQDALFDGLAAAVRELPLDGVDAVGFGIPSRFDYVTGHALGAVNLPLREVDFIAAMNTRLDLPIGVENDASCAAYAEHAHGAGRWGRPISERSPSAPAWAGESSSPASFCTPGASSGTW